MPTLSHNTLESSPDKDGYTYRLCVAPRSFIPFHNITTYNARCFIFSNHKSCDPRLNQTVTAKFSNMRSDTKAWPLEVLWKAKDAGEKASKFNVMIKQMKQLLKLLPRRGTESVQVTILQPQYAMLDSVSFLDHQRQEGDFLVFEDKLKNFKRFINSKGCATAALDRKAEVMKTHFKRSLSMRKKREKVQKATQISQRDRAHIQTSSLREKDNLSYRFPDENGNISMTVALPENQPMLDQPPTYEESQAEMRLRALALGDNVPEYYSLKVGPYLSNVDLNKTHLRPSCPTDSQSEQGDRLSSSSNESFPQMDDDDDDDNCCGPHCVLQAFVHFYFCHAHGQRIISNLQGSFDFDSGFVLTTPTVHSIDQSCGMGDKGMKGIQQVIDNHTCSKLCSHLPDMQQLFDQATTCTPNRHLHL